MAAQGVSTVEVGLIRSVAFIAKPTDRTGSGCVARVNVDHAHTGKLCLIADKRSQLIECPGMAPGTLWVPLLASNRDSLPYPVQVFKRECLTLRARLLHQRLADAVVCVLLKTVFSSGVLAQSPARAAGACQLQTPPMVVAPLPN